VADLVERLGLRERVDEVRACTDDLAAAVGCVDALEWHPRSRRVERATSACAASFAWVHEALARALGDAGVGGQELNVLFGSGIRAVCAGCGLPVTGAELGELTVPGEEDRDRALPPKLERLRLGFCPRNGCEARFFNVEITGPGRFDRGQVLARTRDILDGKSGPRLTLKPVVSPATRKATGPDHPRDPVRRLRGVPDHVLLEPAHPLRPAQVALRHRAQVDGSKPKVMVIPPAAIPTDAAIGTGRGGVPPV
jgi:hypothetical protein